MSVEKYKSIISMEHPSSCKRPRMPVSDRAAQFSPFAALTGYDAVLAETARLTHEKPELDCDELALLDNRLRILSDFVSDRPEIEICYFLPDAKKNGGEYVTVRGSLKKIDAVDRLLVLMDSTVIPISDIMSVEADIFPDDIDFVK